MVWDPHLLRLVEEFRNGQLAIAAATAKETTGIIVAGTNPDDISGSLEATSAAISAATTVQIEAHAVLVEEFLRAFAVGAGMRVADSLISDVVEAAVAGTTRGIGPSVTFHLVARPKELIGQGMAPEQAIRSASTMSAATAQRNVMDAGTEPVLEFTRRTGIRYYRSCAWGACGFCVMLAGRGAVYHEHRKDFKTHIGCRCGCYPAVNGTDMANIGYMSESMWKQIGKDLPGAGSKAHLSEFRRRWRAYQIEHGIIDK